MGSVSPGRLICFMVPADLEERVSRARETIADSCERVGRSPDSVRIVAITKGHPASTLLAALEAGLHEIGENRTQEALEKFGEAHDALESHRPLRHLVGPLQRNKVRHALALFDWVQSVDSLRIARAISERRSDGEPLPVLVEVNIAREPRRHGFEPEIAVERALEISTLTGLRVRGLMAMAPWTDDESVVRGAFSEVRGLFEQLRTEASREGTIDTLSMGMTNDYPLAVEEGSTMVRLGTALFGPRKGA